VCGNLRRAGDEHCDGEGKERTLEQRSPRKKPDNFFHGVNEDRDEVVRPYDASEYAAKPEWLFAVVFPLYRVSAEDGRDCG
jgi:hypothetical protein